VVVRDFDFVGMAILPSEPYPELLVDPDAVLLSPVPTEAFQPIPGRHFEFPNLPKAVDLVELPTDYRPKRLRAALPSGTQISAVKNVFRASISKGYYHGSYYNG
jgi:hypothetical protein